MLYVGVTGITKSEEVSKIIGLFKKYQEKIPTKIYHQLLIGLLISQDLKPRNLRIVSWVHFPSF
jgi:hypothetical protein